MIFSRFFLITTVLARALTTEEKSLVQGFSNHNEFAGLSNVEEIDISSAQHMNYKTIKTIAARNKDFVVHLKDTNSYFVKNPYDPNPSSDHIQLIETDFNGAETEDSKVVSLPITPCAYQDNDKGSVSVTTAFSAKLTVKPSLKGIGQVGFMAPFLMLPVSFSVTDKTTLTFSKSIEKEYSCSAKNGNSVVMLAEVTIPKFHGISQRVVNFTKYKTFVKSWQLTETYMNPLIQFSCVTSNKAVNVCNNDQIVGKFSVDNNSKTTFPLNDNYSLEIEIPQGWKFSQ